MFTAKCVRMFGSVIWPCKTVPPLGLFIFDMFDTQTLRVLAVFLVCHQGVYGAIAKHESCDASAKVGDVSSFYSVSPFYTVYFFISIFMKMQTGWSQNQAPHM